MHLERPTFDNQFKKWGPSGKGTDCNSILSGSIDEFLIKENKRHFWQYVAEVMDIYALGQYRRALGEILDSNWVVGYARISWSALCSPIRTYQRIRASARRRNRLHA